MVSPAHKRRDRRAAAAPTPEAAPRPGGRLSWRLVAAVVLAAAMVRAAHLVLVAPGPAFSYHRTFTESDMHLFDQWARRIAAGDVLGRVPYQPVVEWQLATASRERWQSWYGHPNVFYKAPFYPYLIALLYWLFGDAMLPLAVLQILASVCSVALVVLIGAQLFEPAAGLFAGALFALYGPAIHYDVVMLRGPWIGLVSLVATWQLIGLRDQPTGCRAALLGVTLGLALVVNEGFFLLPPLVLLALAWWRSDARRVVVLAAAMLSGFTLAVAPVIVRNLVVGAPPLAFAVNGNFTYVFFNAANLNPYFFSIPPSFGGLIERSGGTVLGAVRACLESFAGPGAVMLFYLRKALGLIVPFENPDNANFYYAALHSPVLRALPTYALLFPLIVIGLGLALREPRKLAPLLPVLFCLLVSILMTLPVSRYRVVLASCAMPFAGLSLASGVRWAQKRHVLPLGLTLVGAVAVYVAAGELQRRVVFGGRGAEAVLYRPPEFVLGAQFYTERGQLREAAAELLELSRRNPDPEIKASALAYAAGLQKQIRDEAAKGPR